MKIALIQQTSLKNKKKNITKASKHTKQAALNGADIICFSELAFTEFYPQNPSTGNNLELAETIPGPTTDIFCKIAPPKTSKGCYRLI